MSIAAQDEAHFVLISVSFLKLFNNRRVKLQSLRLNTFCRLFFHNNSFPRVFQTLLRFLDFVDKAFVRITMFLKAKLWPRLFVSHLVVTSTGEFS